MRKVYITATVVNPDTEDNFNGWVDLDWNRFELRSEKEDVRFHEIDLDEDVQEYVETLIGSVQSADSGSTFYAHDSVMNPDTGETWAYAAHVED